MYAEKSFSPLIKGKDKSERSVFNQAILCITWIPFKV